MGYPGALLQPYLYDPLNAPSGAITQTPLETSAPAAPLTDPLVAAPATPATPEVPVSPGPMAGLISGPTRDLTQLGEQTGQAQQRVQEEQRMARYAKAAETGTGFWPTALGIYALARGNVGPLLQMQQQKQATRFAQAITPDTIKVNELINAGKFDDAKTLLDTVSVAVGERAPQILPYLQQKAKEISEVQKDMNDLTRAVTYLDVVIHPEHENYKSLLGLKKLQKDASPMSRDMMKEILAKDFSSHFQVIDGMLHRTGAVTGVTVSQAVPAAMRPEAVRANPVLLGVAAAARVTPEELAGILNRIDVQTQDGPVPADSPRANQIREAALGAQPQTAAIGMAKQTVDLTPEVEAELRGMGFTNEQLAAKAYNQGHVNTALERVQQRRTTQVAENKNAEILVQMKRDPTVLEKQVVYEADPANADRFGQAVPLQTVENVINAGGKLNVTDPVTHQKVILPGIKAIRTLNQIPRMFEQLGTPDTWDKAVGTGLATTLQEYLGIAIQPNQTKYQVIRAYIKRAVEDALGTQGVDEIATGTLKSFMTGPITKASDAIDAAALLQQFVSETLYNVTGRRVQVPTGPGTAQPGAAAPVQVSPGVYSAPGSPAGTPAYPPGYTPPAGPVTPKGDVEGALNRYGVGQPGLQTPLPQAPLAPPSTPPALPQGGTAAPPPKRRPNWQPVPGSMKP